MRQCNALLRRVWLFIIALCAGFVVAVAAVPKPAAVPSAHGSAVGADPLTEVVSDINLDYPTYGEAFAWLRQHSRANLFVNWKALKRIGVTPQTRLETELKLHDISLGQILTKMRLSFVEPHATIDSYNWPAYAVDHGLITVATYQDFEPPRLTRAYNVSDLLAAPSTWEVVEQGKSGSSQIDWTKLSPPERLAYVRVRFRQHFQADYSPNEDPITSCYGVFLSSTDAEGHRQTVQLLAALRDISAGKLPPDEPDPLP